MVGVLIVGFCRESIRDRIKHVHSTKVKTGMSGKTGNKGATVLRFEIDDTSFIIANCHLESGQSKTEERVEQWKDVIANAFQEERRGYEFYKHKI